MRGQREACAASAWAGPVCCRQLRQARLAPLSNQLGKRAPAPRPSRAFPALAQLLGGGTGELCSGISLGVATRDAVSARRSPGWQGTREVQGAVAGSEGGKT